MDVIEFEHLEEVLQTLEEELTKMDPAERQALEEEIANEKAEELIKAVEENLGTIRETHQQFINMEDMLEFLEEISAEQENTNSNRVSSVLEKLNKKITEMRVKQRRALGWEEVHELIETAPYCQHKEQIIITRFCPKCKRYSRENICNICATEEDILDLETNERLNERFNNNPYGTYFRKKVCGCCCEKIKEREIWIKTRCTCAAA